MKELQILIIDLYSQYASMIAKRLQEMGIRSAVLSPQKAKVWLDKHTPKGIIFSGGARSVMDRSAPSPPQTSLTMNVPILGICYGMQWLAKQFGGAVCKSKEHGEYGGTTILLEEDELFKDIRNASDPSRIRIVWASHGDTVKTLPPGFRSIAASDKTKGHAAMSHAKRRIWGVQFHPESLETKKCGKQVLRNFAYNICNCKEDWKPKDIAQSIRDEVKEAIGRRRIVGGFSGGVDSSTLFAILSPVFKERLEAVCINAGQLRQGEVDEIRENAEVCGIKPRIVHAASRFQRTMRKNVINAQIKREQWFNPLYGKILEEEAQHSGATVLIQGSLATDFIESGAEGGAVIKSHHNIGLEHGLEMDLHPFRGLFKYEVRDLAREIGLPSSIVDRHPFPGPGLFIRVIGAPPTPKRLNIVRWADTEVTKILKKSGVYSEISQLVVALLCTPMVGVKGDARVYGPSIMVRAVETTDFMTADGYYFPEAIWREIEDCITKHPHIVTVLSDSTSKPPRTIEFE